MQITMKQTALDDAHPASDRAWRDSQPGFSKPRVSRRRSRLLPGWLAILGFFAPVTACFAASSLLSPENRRDLELQPGVVLILVQYKATLGAFSCSPGVLGSGFLYRPDGYLITNGHVAQLANEKDHKADIQRMITAEPLLRQAALESVAKQLGRDLTDPEKQVVVDQVDKLIAGGQMRVEDVKLTVILDNGTSHQGEIKAYSDPINENGKDVAIIKIDARNVPTVALGNSDDVSVGDSLTVVGYPGEATNATMGGLFSERSLLIPTVTNGRISAVNKTDYKGTPVLQSEAVINHGNSGGPAFDDQGRVVGIATYTLNKTEGSVAGLNFFVPINTAMEFVRQAGADPQRGPFDRTWHDALEAYAGQHWYKAHELMGSVLEEMPNQPDAMKLQLQSAQNIRNLNPVQYWIDRLGMGEFAVLATVLVLVLFVAVLLLVRKPGSKPVVASAPLQRTAEPLPATVPSVQTVKAVLPGIESFGSLYVSNGPLSGNRFQIPKKGLLIGRDSSQCGLVLPDDNVSKEHAWVVPLDNGVAVIDRSSTNGTYVNSADSPRINKMLLKNGDRIFIGRKNPTEITYFSS